MLCPIYTLDTETRHGLIRQHQLSVLTLPRRTHFRKANGEEKRGTPYLSVWVMRHPEHVSKLLY
jgi:hypothetical protein